MCLKFLSLRRIERGIIINVHKSPCKVPAVLTWFEIRKNYRKSNFIKIRPSFSDFAHARDESSTFGRLVHDVDGCDVAARWRNSGNTKQSDRQCLWVNRTALQPDVWQSDRWPCAAAECLMERRGLTCSNFFPDTPAEPNMSAVTNNHDTMKSSGAKVV